MTNPESGPSPEEAAERVPTPEEVHAVFRELAKGEYKEIRKLEDATGLYLMEIEVAGKEEGEVIEYAYMRKGSHTEGAILATEIHVTYYQDGAPISGTSAAKYENGSWRVLKD